MKKSVIDTNITDLRIDSEFYSDICLTPIDSYSLFF